MDDVPPSLTIGQLADLAAIPITTIRSVADDASPGRATTKQLAADRIEAINHQLTQLDLARSVLAATIECRCPTVEECHCGAMDEPVERSRPPAWNRRRMSPADPDLGRRSAPAATGNDDGRHLGPSGPRHRPASCG